MIVRFVLALFLTHACATYVPAELDTDYANSVIVDQPMEYEFSLNDTSVQVSIVFGIGDTRRNT